MASANLSSRLRYAVGNSGEAHGELLSILGPILSGNAYYVNTFNGNSSRNDGRSWEFAFSTMAAALSAAQTGDTIFFRGKIAEQLVGSNLKFDITIVGVGSLHHHDQPTSAYDGAGSSWVPPASPAATTPLLEVRGRGWRFINIMFDAPADAAAVMLSRNALSTTSEYDASHASFLGCDFRNGLYGIQDVGGCFNVTVRDCTFETFNATSSGAAIICTSTAVAVPRRYRIIDNFFQPESSTQGNERHIIGAFNGSLIRGNVFGTVHNTGLYIDLTGGTGNVVTENTCMGTWATADYKGGTGDSWVGNYTAVDASTSAVGYSIAVPD